jgi:hypothetical protein
LGRKRHPPVISVNRLMVECDANRQIGSPVWSDEEQSAVRSPL